MSYIELTNEQRRQIIDTQQAYSVWSPAQRELEGFGTMRVQSSKGRRYVYKCRGLVRKSLGRETPSLKRKKAEHDARRKELQKRVKSLDKRLKQLAPINRAMNLGRVPDIAARIIRALDAEQLLGSHVIVVGTNALHAYETATGTIINQEHVATTDADLAWDPGQHLFLAATGIRKHGLMGVLKKVDKSFEADYGFNAKNSDGYIVDLLCPETSDYTTMNAGSDLEAVPMEGIKWLLKSPQFEQDTLGEDGLPFRLVVPDPRTFALHKLWVSKRTDRQALKRPRDRAHAFLVAELVTKYLGQRFLVKEMPWLPPPLRSLTKEFKSQRK